MKTHNRKKIIIGYRYDPNTHSIQRLHELQATDDFSSISSQTTEKPFVKIPYEPELIRTLKN
jgi:hypothetical protein